MKIGIIVTHPFQFEGPFYQYVSAQEQDQLEVLFTNNSLFNKIYDNELNEKIDWGIDLTSGYNWEVLPIKKWGKLLRNFIKNSNFDLIIINGYYTRHFLFAALWSKKFRIPVALRLDTVSFNNKTIIKRIYKYFLFKFLDKIYHHFFVVGSLSKEYLQSFGISKERISYFSYVVDNDYFRSKSTLTMQEKKALRDEYSIPDDHKIILCVAKFNNREAPIDLINAFNIIDSKHKLCLLLVGDGILRKQLVDIASQNKYNKIIFTGYIPYPKLPKIYGISDLFVHPSRNEPWGVSVQEALASGLPVITSDMVGSSKDLIINGKNGYIYTVGDIDKLKELIMASIQNDFKESAKIFTAEVLNIWNYKNTWNNLISVCYELKKLQNNK